MATSYPWSLHRIVLFAYLISSPRCSLSFQLSQRTDKVATCPRSTSRSTKVPSTTQVESTGRRDRRDSEREVSNKDIPGSIPLDAMDARRRQLLVSMLATASSGVLTSNSVAQTASLNEPKANVGVTSPDFLDIIKPPLDERNYVAYTLENGLRVLLCSDPSSSNEAAAAMDVHVGACSDPDYLSGLAHFNEHMLFLGTKKFPIEDSFGKYLSLNGGSSNAYTDSENTVYYFTINAETDNRIAEGLSRFGSFYSAPLFTESATGREVNAIESENAKNLQSDLFRNYQITKARANREHPFSKFYTGNKKTLIDGAKEKGVDLRNELLKFHTSFYSANQMTLAVVAPQSIDTLKQMVSESFSDIPNRMVPKPEEAWNGVAPFANENSIIPSFRHVVEIVPVSDLRQVQVSWPIVYGSEADQTSALLVKPSEYVAHLLGHEGPRSLLSYLKRKGWAITLGCSNAEELSDFETFDVVVGVTPQGLAAVDKVIEAIFSYLSILQQRTIPDYVFQEVLQLQELQWRFQTKGGAGGYATALCTAMQKYPPALYVAGPQRLALDDYTVAPQLSDAPRSSFPTDRQLRRTREQVENYASTLTVDNAMVTVVSKSFAGQTDATEQWYGTNYRARAIPSATLDRWRNCDPPRSLNIDFPLPNRFIPSEAGLRVNYAADNSRSKRKSFEELMVAPIPPRIILNDDRWKVYFKEDKEFGKPKAYVVLQLQTKEAYSSPMNAMLATLYELSVTDNLREYAYDGLLYEIRILPRGIRLTFSGYNDKLKDFAVFVTRNLALKRNYLPNDDDFQKYVDVTRRTLASFDVNQPYAHASYYTQLTLQPNQFTYDNRRLRESLEQIQLSDLSAYVNTIWTAGKVECLVQGNYVESEALDLIRSLDKALPFKSIAEADLPSRLEVLPLPASDSIPRLLISEPNPANTNSASFVTLQNLRTDPKEHVLIELLHMAVIDEPFYDDLRTQRQLGYIVASGVKSVANTRTMSFIVQSSVLPSSSVTKEILGFLQGVETRISKFSAADLSSLVKSLIRARVEPVKDLSSEVMRNWAEIANGKLQFDRLSQEVIALLDLEDDLIKSELIDTWRRTYGSGRRALITEMIPQNSSLPPPLKSTGYIVNDLPTNNFILGIDDIETFRQRGTTIDSAVAASS